MIPNQLFWIWVSGVIMGIGIGIGIGKTMRPPDDEEEKNPEILDD